MYRHLVILIILAVLCGCQGTPRYGGGHLGNNEGERKTATRKQSAPQQKASKYAVDPIVLGEIIDTFLGRPSAGKSTERKGYDCSEFIGTVYYEYASIHLPRTTEKLFVTGREVERGDLYFGDLVFFDTGGRGVSHVGIYVGFDEFVHASTSNGIIISSLLDKYYKKRFLGARRVME
ncbi:MAG: hypothetical protein GY841_02000 [FCB group bacterium]|nr:hypothetical protein [FCB group bacterium]